MRVLVVNAGSSSLKLRVLDDNDHVLADHHVEEWYHGERGDLQTFVAELDQPPDAVGHRVVHGGTRFIGPAVLDDVLPDVPAVACFDTAFHATMPARAATYALPLDWRERWGLRRFGFHGLSHAYAARRSAELTNRPVEDLRVVTCHLGAGASLAAVHGGRSMDTTMGFTPLDGLVMATRSGSVDPGLPLWLIQHRGIPVNEVYDALENRSGLTGLAGTGDMRAVLAAADVGDPSAELALDVYVHAIATRVGAMAVSLGGIDALSFTGGVGEHAAPVRSRVARALQFLGVAVDPDRNAVATRDRDVTATGAPVRTVVVTAREDVEIARQVRAVLGPAPRQR